MGVKNLVTLSHQGSFYGKRGLYIMLRSDKDFLLILEKRERERLLCEKRTSWRELISRIDEQLQHSPTLLILSYEIFCNK